MSIRFIKIVRVLAVLFGAFAAAVALPSLYRMISVKGSEYKKVVYSEVLNDFVISEYVLTQGREGVKGSGGTIYRDTKGNTYTSEQLYDIVILENASQLIYDGNFPDTVCGVAVTPEMVSAYSYTMYFGDRGSASYGIYDLKDRMSYTSKKLRTQDVFRMGEKGIEFIDAPSNSVIADKTAAFNAAFTAVGFVFPADFLWAPADRTDAEVLGYFIADANGDLFRMCMVLGEPEVVKMELPDTKRVRNMNFTDRADFLAMVIAEDGTTYLMDRDYKYKLLPLPNMRNMRVVMEANPLFRKFSYSYNDRTDYYVTDAHYNMLDSCSVGFSTYEQTTKFKIQQVLFPVMIRQSAWGGFSFTWSDVRYFALLNLVLVALMVLYKRSKGQNPLEAFNMVDIVIVAVLGMFGFVGVLAMPVVRQNRKKLKS